jgi:rhodanese-related sulfurtransferase
MVEEVSVTQARRLMKGGAVLLDVRTKGEWDRSRLPGAILIPLHELPHRLAEVPQGDVIVYCHHGNRSKTGAMLLTRAGRHAMSMRGGIDEWSDTDTAIPRY